MKPILDRIVLKNPKCHYIFVYAEKRRRGKIYHFECYVCGRKEKIPARWFWKGEFGWNH